MRSKLFVRLTAPCVPIIAAVLFGPAAAWAGEPGDPHAGRNFALDHCAECHAVKEDEAISPNAGAPSFTSVANTSGMTGRALAAWIETSHPTMPNFILTKQDRDDVVAYIMSLKRNGR